ncbi:MAG: FG-GAP-like repeat-containing protein [Saprospiraceae bacterium]
MKQILLFATSFFFFHNLIGQTFTQITTGDIVNINSASRSANFIDVNNDGWDDIFISNGPSIGQNNMLYLNNQDGTFTTVSNDPIVGDGAKSDGATFGDVDNDGDLDACVVTWYGQTNNFYRGQSGGVFGNENNVIGQSATYSETASWGDMDNDGWLDLYVTNSDGIKKNKLYHNLGDGNFEEITTGPMVEDAHASRSVDWIDYDNDGDSDLFVTNESNQKNDLYQNDGSGNFTKIIDLIFLNSNKNSTGSSWADIDNDGDFDLFIANYQGQENQLFFNNGDGTFTETSGEPIVLEQGWSFGTSFADADNDGDLDLFICNAFGSTQKNSFYINNGDGTFYKDVSSSPSAQTGWTFGCAWGDYNNDGFLDLVLANCKDDNQINGLFENDGNDNNWFKLSCEGSQINRSAIGTIVKAKVTINGESIWQTRRIVGQSGYNCQNSLTVHFGLGEATMIDSLIINWGVGNEQVFENVEVNNFCTLKEGEMLDCETTVVNDITIHSRKFKIYPNPSSGDSVEIENPFFPNQNLIKMKVLDGNGKVVFTKEIKNGEEIIKSNFGKMASGIYQIVLSQKDKFASSTLIIQ